jgi:uncharacterized SAM-binding protein YcdF (DUF218 family)
VLIVLVFSGLAVWGASRVGRWLVVEDPLDRATAIVVLGGHVPFRAMEAAELYGAKWAPEVWLTRQAGGAEEAAMAKLGLDSEPGDTRINRVVLRRLGVPVNATRTLIPGVRNTADELRLVGREMAASGASQVIIVTSKAHSRRVRDTWRAIFGKTPRAIVRYAESDDFDAARWWDRTSDVLAVSREVFGLMNVWTGFPVRPDKKAMAGQQPDPAPSR